MIGGDSGTGAEETAVDPVTLEVIRNAAAAISEEMNANLIRTGYSPNIKERRDCSCAVFDADGEMISQAENMPVHLGAMPFSVEAALERYPPESLEPGDAILLNDPFRGGAHLPDLTLVSPVYAAVDTGPDAEANCDGAGDAEADCNGAGDVEADCDGAGDAAGDDELIAFAANRAHHADVGGSRAGSVAADSTEIYQEGIRIPPVKLYEGGDLVDDVMELLLANVRTPDERRGDLRAQQAANETARERIHDLVDEYGTDMLRAAVAEVQDYAERRMRAELADLPDGSYSFADVLDDDGRGTEDVRIKATVTIDGDAISVDFAGTDPQTEGPINAVFAVTASATYYAVRCVTDPDVPANEGAYRPIEIEAPEGTVVNAEPPAAVVGGNLEASQRVTDVVLGALAEAAPERAIGACQGTMNNVTFGGTDPGTDEPYAFYETGGGGFGGRASGDGMDGVHVHMSNTMNTPAEVLQTVYPLSVERYEFRPDTGGPGEHRGGVGLRRDYRVRDHEAAFSILADRRAHAPYGVRGGHDGGRGDDRLVRDGASEPLASKCTRDLRPGDVVSVRTPGAGGHGDPADRDPDAVRRDVELGKVSAERARDVYGVEVDVALDVDDDEPDMDADADVDETDREYRRSS